MSALESILGHPAVVGTAWVLLHFLWQGAVIALGLVLVLLVLPRGNAAARFWAATVAMALLFLAPVATAITFVMDGLGLAAERAATLGALNGPGFDAAGGAGGAGAMGGAGAGLPAALPFVSSAISRIHPSEPWLAALVLFWMAGVVLLSIRNLNGYAEVRFLTRMGTTAPPAEWIAVVRRLSAALGVPRTVRLAGSTLVRVPTVIGWLRPVILVPVGAFTGLHPRHLEAILAHELAHVRRHDYLLNLIQTVVETLLFYHPAVWWVSRRIREEREHCCDDVAAASVGDAVLVARALAEMEALRGVHLGFAVRADGGSLLSRVARLVGASPRGRRLGDRWLPTTFVVATVLGLSLIGMGALRSTSDAKLAERVDPVERVTLIDESSLDDIPVVVGNPVILLADADETGADDETSGTRSSRDYGVHDGTWSAKYRDGHLTVSVEYGHSDWTMGSNVREFGITEEQVEMVLGNPDIDIDFPKDAGTFHLTGKVTARGSTSKAKGKFTFEPDPGYTRALMDLGYPRDEIETLQMELAGHDVSRRYIKDMADLGYKDIPLSRLVEFRIHGISVDYARGMHDAGYPDLEAERLVEFRIHGVTPDYVRGMSESGFPRLDPEKIVEFRIHGITPDYVKGMANAGFTGLDDDRIVEFRVHGITPDYVQGMAEAGYSGMSADEIVEFRVQGITPDYVQGMASAGYAQMDADRMVEFRIQGVTPEYVRGLVDAGFGDLTPEKLVEFRIHGVDPEYARAMHESGLLGVTAEKVIEMRIHGVTPDFVAQVRERVRDLTAEEVIEIKIQGLDRYLKRTD